MSRSILVIAVHPDDETLGAGGTLLKHKKNGDKIHWLVVTKMNKEHGFSQDKIDKRAIEIKKVANHFCFDSVTELDFPTTRLDTINESELVDSISKVIRKVEPHTIYLPCVFDVHSDHRKVFSTAYSCTKNFRYPFIKKILMMETLSETDFAPNIIGQGFLPNVFIDISNEISEKMLILNIYEGEIKEAPFPRSEHAVLGQAAFRGASACSKYAEAFMLLKEVEN